MLTPFADFWLGDWQPEGINGPRASRRRESADKIFATHIIYNVCADLISVNLKTR